jgi:hypothetical protein
MTASNNEHTLARVARAKFAKDIWPAIEDRGCCRALTDRLLPIRAEGIRHAPGARRIDDRLRQHVLLLAVTFDTKHERPAFAIGGLGAIDADAADTDDAGVQPQMRCDSWMLRERRQILRHNVASRRKRVGRRRRPAARREQFNADGIGVIGPPSGTIRSRHFGAIAHRLCRLVWKILHERVRYEERGPAVDAQAARVRTRKMIRALRGLGYRVELPSPPPITE